jgi:hypothetical protein
MEQIPTPKDALAQLVEALGPKKKESLKSAIQAIQLIVDPPKRAGPGSFWQDPERGAQARAAMSASWAARRSESLQVTWRASGKVELFSSYEEVAKLVGRAPHTVRIYISKGKGVAYFAHNDDAITVQRL